jgi:3-deoxy-manno-octulosonate cytidylyltransferase (CMP-KDO synthetase)
MPHPSATTSQRALIIIPARMQATRLPGKPLADIHGEPMIVHVWRRAIEAHAGRVVVATDSDEIIAAVNAVGGEAVMTRADHASGSDRVYEVVSADIVINLQGDLPTLDPWLVTACAAPLLNRAPAGGPDIATIAAEIADPAEKTASSVVKVIGTPLSASVLRALYFTRATAPWGEGPLYHHIGIYAYTRQALERFVTLKPSPLEMREKLEQLRALEAGMRIEVALVDTVPLGVDTPHDLERARRMLAPKS